MKKFIIATAALFTLTACGSKTVYVVDTLPSEDVDATEAPETTVRPRPTTTVKATLPPYNSYTSEDRYIDGVYQMYPGTVYLSDYELLNMGYTICDTLDTGVSLDTVVAVISANMPASNDMAEFVASILASAIYNICPQHTWQVPTN